MPSEIASQPGARFVMPEPNSEPQKQFFLAKNLYVAYGGARGGGKTWAARHKAELLAFRYAGIRILILRRTFPELRQFYIREMGAELHGFARYNESHKLFTFANRSTIELGYCARERDADQYQGREYDIIIVDEATHFTEEMFKKLCSCLRGVNDFPKRVYLTCNPGGVGHAWVKRLFISRRFEPGEKPEDYRFIPAKVTDNRDLMESDPEYVNRLQNLSPELRRAWLEGDWDVFIGQYFSEWRRDTHVVTPFPIPAHWRRYYTLDYGLDMLAGYLVVVDEAGYAYVVSEVFEGRDNGCGTGGGGLLISEAAARVRDMVAGQKIDAFFAPPDLWNRRQDTGRSAADIFAEMGVPLTKVNNNRVQGWMDLKEWLRPLEGPEGKPTARLRVFENCENLIEGIPSLVYSDKDPSDCASEPHIHTHGPDALRYWVAGRPFAASAPVVPGEWEDEGQGYDAQVDDFLAFGI